MNSGELGFDPVQGRRERLRWKGLDVADRLEEVDREPEIRASPRRRRGRRRGSARAGPPRRRTRRRGRRRQLAGRVARRRGDGAAGLEHDRVHRAEGRGVVGQCVQVGQYGLLDGVGQVQAPEPGQTRRVEDTTDLLRAEPEDLEIQPLIEITHPLRITLTLVQRGREGWTDAGPDESHQASRGRPQGGRDRRAPRSRKPPSNEPVSPDAACAGMATRRAPGMPPATPERDKDLSRLNPVGPRPTPAAHRRPPRRRVLAWARGRFPARSPPRARGRGDATWMTPELAASSVTDGTPIPALCTAWLRTRW